MPKDVVDATVVHMRERGVAVSTIALVFKTTVPAVRQVLERHRLARSARSETAETGSGCRPGQR
jgi:hypothetical protein